ncbi:MAG: helix-turn-helix transcriptional regulator [Clostridia bacterium]|nr:helix-turn-helix transcriptional regulator [Clostridia bacterium]
MDLLTVQRNLIKAQQDYISILSEQSKVTGKIYKSNDEEIEDIDIKEVPQKDCSTSIGKNLQDLRKKAGYTQEELAEKVGIGRSMLAQIERGTKTISLPLADIVADELHCSIYDFLGKPEPLM